MVSRAVLDGCGKSRLHRVSIPGPSSHAIPARIVVVFCIISLLSRVLNETEMRKEGRV